MAPRKRQRKRQASVSSASSSGSSSSSEEEQIQPTKTVLPLARVDASSSSSEASSSSSDESSEEDEKTKRRGRNARINPNSASGKAIAAAALTTAESTTTQRRPYPSRSPSPAAFNPANVPLGANPFPLLRQLKQGPILAGFVPGDEGFVAPIVGNTVGAMDKGKSVEKEGRDAAREDASRAKEAQFGEWWRARLVSEFEKELGGLAAVRYHSSHFRPNEN